MRCIEQPVRGYDGLFSFHCKFLCIDGWIDPHPFRCDLHTMTGGRQAVRTRARDALALQLVHAELRNVDLVRNRRGFVYRSTQAPLLFLSSDRQETKTTLVFHKVFHAYLACRV